MDVDWSIVNQAKNLVEDQLDLPILKVPIVDDNRRPLVQFMRPGMRILDIGGNNRSLKDFIQGALKAEVIYKSMDVDRTHSHDFYSLEEISGEYDAVACFEVVEHMPAGKALELLCRAHDVLVQGGRLFVSTPNVYHPMSFWSDSTHITPYRLRHLAGWMGTAGFTRLWGFRVVRMTWKKRLRYWRYRGLLRLLNLDFAPGILVVGEKQIN
jgi:SAM-dependent methyltransferase